jgi:hydrogenase maturation protease
MDAENERGEAPLRKTAVIGVGNILMKDDGVGVHAVRAMERRELPGHVVCIDGGTASFEALDAADDCERIVVLDALKMGGEPGTVYRMTLEEWRAQRSVSLHDVTLFDAISISDALDRRDRPVTVYGVEPETISPGIELTTAVKRGLEKMIKSVDKELWEERP